MERLMSVDPRINLHILKELKYRDAVRLCRADKRFLKVCRSRQGSDMLRDKEATECVVPFLWEMYIGWREYDWYLTWDGVRISHWRMQEVDTIPTSVPDGMKVSEKYASTLFSGRATFLSWFMAATDTCVENRNRAAMKTDIISEEMEDLAYLVAKRCGWKDTDREGPDALAQLLDLRLVKIDNGSDPGKSVVSYTMGFSLKRWLFYWKRGTSNKMVLFKPVLSPGVQFPIKR